MKNKTNTTREDVNTSVNSIYSNLIEKRKYDKAEKEYQKEMKKKVKKEQEQGVTVDVDENGNPLTKKARREKNFNELDGILIGLTGEDLEYVDNKKGKKKYKKWIDEESGNINSIETKKNKKGDKKNYNKEFAPEMNVLKGILNDQNKFTTDLQKRFLNAAGPATRDAMPLTKTQVELVAAINSSRTNSLSVIKEINNVKKTIANLYHAEKKLNGMNNSVESDLGLMGTNIASSLFASQPVKDVNASTNNNPTEVVDNDTTLQLTATSVISETNNENLNNQFDPNLWDDENIDVGNTNFENMNCEIVVDVNADNAEFVAIDTITGEPIDGYPLPQTQIKTIDEKNKLAKDSFDTVYKLKE